MCPFLISNVLLFRTCIGLLGFNFYFLNGIVTSIYARLEKNMPLERHCYHTNHIHMILEGKIQLYSLKCQKCTTSIQIPLSHKSCSWSACNGHENEWWRICLFPFLRFFYSILKLFRQCGIFFFLFLFYYANYLISSRCI